MEYYCQPKQQQPVLDTDFNKLVNDKETADVSFNAGRRVFYAQKSILKMRAPDLYELATQFDKDTRMPIQGVDPDIFQVMLKYVYGKVIPPNEWAESSKQILRLLGSTDLLLSK